MIYLDKDDDGIWIINHEEPEEIYKLNSSLSLLYDSILCYSNFVNAVNRLYGNGAYINNKFPESHVEKLKLNLELADKKAFENNGFWRQEVDKLTENI